MDIVFKIQEMIIHAIECFLYVNGSVSSGGEIVIIRNQ